MSCQQPADEELLSRLDEKLQLIRDRVQGVADGYNTGFFLWGEGGTSKSFTVEQTLKRLGKSFKLTNSRLSGKGLFDLLRDFPDIIHILDDVETLFNDKNSFGTLRSALGGHESTPGWQERPVNWQVAGNREEFLFTGGIVFISNCRLGDIPQLRALKTRLVTTHYRPTNEEIAALMRDIACQGHRHGPYFLPPDECLEVVQEIVARSQRLQRNLDIRLYVNSCKDRLQWANGAAETDWHQLLDSRMNETASPGGDKYESRAERKGRELAIARRIADLPPLERLEVWKKETGKSRPALYRRLEDLKKEPSHFSRFHNPNDN